MNGQLETNPLERAEVSRSGPTAASMKAIGQRTRPTTSDDSFIEMVTFTRASGWMTKPMATATISTKMAHCIAAIGRMTHRMAGASNVGPTAPSSKGTTNRV